VQSSTQAPALLPAPSSSPLGRRAEIQISRVNQEATGTNVRTGTGSGGYRGQWNTVHAQGEKGQGAGLVGGYRRLRTRRLIDALRRVSRFRSRLWRCRRGFVVLCWR
jgi:hypothetical protein